LVQLISLSAYQRGLKQIDFATATHVPSDEFEAGDLPLVCPLDKDEVIAARTVATSFAGKNSK
jgi:hypothetical protein